MKLYINPYKTYSDSAKLLQEKLRDLGIHTLRSQDPPKRRRAVINWGNTHSWDANHLHVLNRPSEICRLVNKLTFFQTIGRTGYAPEWTVDRDWARTWEKGVARTILTGSGGAGIVVFNEGDDIPEAPLYTKYEKKTHEYRIHLGRHLDGYKVIAVQRKVFVKGELEQPKNWDVRNLENGFVYHTQDRNNVPEAVALAAYNVFFKFGVTFAAMDVIYHEKSDKAFVLEGNSAPGLIDRTAEAYAQYFKEVLFP
jgi:glutathione synthase/RimK-type ligase-like ATP-grasp enzyme